MSDFAFATCSVGKTGGIVRAVDAARRADVVVLAVAEGELTVRETTVELASTGVEVKSVVILTKGAG